MSSKTEALLKPIIIEPDGPQGGKVVLGIKRDGQISDIKQALGEKNMGFTIENIKKVAKDLKIPVVDH